MKFSKLVFFFTLYSLSIVAMEPVSIPVEKDKQEESLSSDAFEKVAGPPKEKEEADESLPEELRRRKKDAKVCSSHTRGWLSALGFVFFPTFLRNLPFIGGYMPVDFSHYAPAALAAYTISRSGSDILENGIPKTLVIQVTKSVTESPQFEEFKKALAPKVVISQLAQALADQTEVYAHVDAADRDLPAMRRILRNFAKIAIEEYKDNGKVKEAVDSIIREILNERGELRKGLKNISKFVAEDFEEMVTSVLEGLFNEGGAAYVALENTSNQLEYSLKKATATIVLGGVVLVTAWFGSKVTWSHVDRILGRPTLVQESSYSSFLDGSPWFKQKKVLPRLVFAPELKDRLNGIAKATRNISKKIKQGEQNVKYRNLLLWGKPGTGKTMFARVLADHSGMDYDIMSGASFAQFANGEGITEMNKLFKRAAARPNGTIIVIDEAEAFAGARMQGEASGTTKQAYQLLTNFLHLTGDGSDKIMLVFCTNRADALDPAMGRRIHDIVEMKLPGLEERSGILKMYRNEQLLDPSDNTEAFIASATACLSNEKIEAIARKTVEFCGDELREIINILVSDASITDDGLITTTLIDKVVQQAIDKHRSFAQNFNVGKAG